MKTKRLQIALGMAVLALVGYNGIIAVEAERSQRQRALAALAHPPADTEVVFLGNSLMEAGYDPASFRSAWSSHPTAAPSLNLALSATTPVEHYLIWKRALEHNLKPKWLIYGYFDDQLNATNRGDWSDLVGNRAFSYYFPEQAAELYAPGSSVKRWELSLSRCLPMIAERSSLWTKVEHWRRQIEAVGMPVKKTTRFGRVEDFGPRSPVEVASFENRCSVITDGKVGFSTAIRKIVELAHAHQIRVLLVEMPMPKQHRESFYSLPVWPRLRDHVRHLAVEADVTYLNASDWVGDDGQFADSMHLNPDGARVFSDRLARSLAQLDPPGGLNGAELAQHAVRKNHPTTE